ncbi:MAG: OadG family protein [Bacteroidales bacterium]
MNSLLILLKSNITLESLVIAVAGYSIVFVALVLLYGLFNQVPRVIRWFRMRGREEGGPDARTPIPEGLSGEETAAIAMALHLYLDEFHDEESGVLTIERISRAYSPWSSKIYEVRNQFNRQ